MKETPIIFSTPMVQAILDLLKRITRRLNGLEEINENPDKWKPYIGDFYVDKKGRLCQKFFNGISSTHAVCPYGNVGDLLWVKENFIVQQVDRIFKSEWMNHICIDFVASEGRHTDELRHWFYIPEKNKPKVIRRRHPIDVFESPSIFLPKRCARLWLQITNIRVERLKEISGQSAEAEGVQMHYKEYGAFPMFRDYQSDKFVYDNAEESFKSLWSLINGQDSWNANPWVWVIEFKELSRTGKPSTG